MCGINGLLDRSIESSEEELRTVAVAGAATLQHRGPDDSGVWVDAAEGVALAHRRLSIIDLSAEGHQPMVSHDGRFVIIYNGEIYNYRDIRAELERGQPLTWRGHSDTEVMLEAFSRWGAHGTLTRLNGMFAIALWDRQRRELLLARDRIGEKPLYYAWIGSTLVFASELRALRAHPRWNGTISPAALQLLFRHGYIPAPLTIFTEAHKLPPGSFLRVSGSGVLPQPEAYWSADKVFERAAHQPFDGTGSEAVAALESLLQDAVRIRMEADVPLGAFLSGGIDSSTVVALMQAHSSRPVRTFSIGFREEGYNEAVHAAAVARHIGTDHTELYVTPEEAWNIVPRLGETYDEPFADSSQIPTCLLAALTRKYVTVCLSGDGGDELFGGYTRYARLQRDWSRVRRIPAVLRRIAAGGVGAVLRRSRAVELIAATDPRQFYLRKVSAWNVGDEPLLNNERAESPAFEAHPVRGLVDVRNLAMELDLVSYLPDDILVKVDRATMAVSLEGRIPMLDHRIVEWAASLPLRFKISGDTTKWVVRQIAYKYIPRPLLEREKQGFGVPLGTWLRGPLRDWAESLLPRQSGLLDVNRIAALWRDHLEERSDESSRLWTVLMFQSWLKTNSR